MLWEKKTKSGKNNLTESDTSVCTMPNTVSTYPTSIPNLSFSNLFFFFFNHTAPTEIYTLSLHDALPILAQLEPDQLTGTALRAIACGGEALTAQQANRWSRPGLELHNPYGPTETTVVVTDYICPTTPLTTPPPIGAPLPNQRAYVLDHRLRPAPIGIPGELHLAGTGLAHGYHHRPGLTAQRFLAEPYGPPGQRMHANGDLPRWRSDGQLEYHGRRDRQVQLRGQRIELGEIEHTLTQHPDVRQSAVTVHDNTLVGYLVGDPDLDDVRRHLADRLPTHMIPTALVPLPEPPITPNGKLDTARLPDPSPRTVEYRQPRTDTERWLANTWQDLLGVDQISATDNFFDLGGNSLHVTQLVARIRDHDGTDLHPRQVFTNPVLGHLATRLDQADPLTVDEPIAPVPRIGPLPCTRQQEGMWFQHQLDPSSAVYHIGLRLWLRGRVDVAALGRAVHGLVTRHEALRTRFVNLGGLPQQENDPPPPAAPLPIVDIEAEGVDAWVTGEIRRPLDLEAGHLFRCRLARIAPNEHVLLLLVHHIVADGWSAHILADELSRLYALETGVADEALPALTLQPADHAAWQRGRLHDGDLDR